MPIKVNLRHLEEEGVELEGESSPEDLELDTKDEAIQAKRPLHYELQVEELEDSLLVQGRLELVLDCECVRCLKNFPYKLTLDPYTLHLPLQGDEAAPVAGDFVDLTPYIREDILLELPRHPHCKPECGGLAGMSPAANSTTESAPSEGKVSPWDELNKLKL
jgi:uncharacterized metal-binding protein YceD (DUF177 family)